MKHGEKVNKELSLVEVLMVKYKKDLMVYGDELARFDLFSDGTDSCRNFVEKKDNGLLVTEDFVAFLFKCIGQNFYQSYSSGIEEEWYEMGAEEQFGPFINKFIEMGESIANAVISEERLNPELYGDIVRFITVWEFVMWKDSYYGEWDSERNLIGLLDIDKLEQICSKKAIT